ncbi:MAG: hypothetical protein ACTS22_09520 [Phycisphaerales bacterium]
MSQFGMSMPGGRRAKRSGVDVYTGLLCLSVLALGTAVALMYLAATKVSPDAGNPFALQDEGSAVRLPQ